MKKNSYMLFDVSEKNTTFSLYEVLLEPEASLQSIQILVLPLWNCVKLVPLDFIFTYNME